MRIVFMGSPSFAVPTLEAVLAAGHEVVGVVTQPNRPAGRGLAPVPPPVKVAALARGFLAGSTSCRASGLDPAWPGKC